MTIDHVLVWLQQASEHFLNALDQGSYLSIVLLMAVESSLIPFPSEVIMIPAGILVAEGRLNFFGALGSAILGSLGGGFINYYLAYFLGRPAVFKVGRFFWLSEEKLISIENYFVKYGDLTTFFGRLIPGVRQLISLPAGLAKMNVPKFAFYTGLGAGIWSLILLVVGMGVSRLQEDWHVLWHQYNLALVLAILGLCAIGGTFVVTKRRKRFRP